MKESLQGYVGIKYTLKEGFVPIFIPTEKCLADIQGGLQEFNKIINNENRKKISQRSTIQ